MYIHNIFLNRLRVIYIHHGPLSLSTSMYMQSSGVPSTILTLRRSSGCLGVPKMNLSLDSLLEELSELSRAVTLVVTLYYLERKRIKIIQQRRHLGQSPGEAVSRPDFRSLLPVGS